MVSNRVDNEKSPFLSYCVYDAFEWAEAERVGLVSSLGHSFYVTTNSVV
jgi:hypothetical protein